MKHDWSTESSARSIFRCLALIPALLLLVGAALRIIQLSQRAEFIYDSVFKTAVSWFVCGVIFLVIAWRGYLFKRKNRE
jgi:hypothetical protein